MNAGLGVRVGLTIVNEAAREVALQGEVLRGEVRVRSQSVAQCQLVAGAPRVDRDEVEMMSAATRAWLAEPVHLLGEVRRVHVAERRQRLETGARLIEISHSGQDVDDRLSLQPRHRGAADVVDAAEYPVPNRLLQRYPLLLEPGGPGRVVRREPDRLVGGQWFGWVERVDVRIISQRVRSSAVTAATVIRPEQAG